jgi:hypothetical protein
LSHSVSLLIFFFLAVLGIELGVLCFATWATPPVHFALVILETEVLKLFAWPGFELWSSRSPKLLGLQVWATDTWQKSPYSAISDLGQNSDLGSLISFTNSHKPPLCWTVISRGHCVGDWRGLV